MFKQLLLDNRLFGALVCFIVFIAAGLGYLHTVKRDAQREVQHLQEMLQQKQPPKPQTEAKPPPPGETAETGHWHGDVWHTEPHDTHAPATTNTSPPSAVAADTQVSPPPAPDFSGAYQTLREKYPEQTQNPPPFENVPVDLWDFEATKKAFQDHFNFYMAQGGNKPEVFNNNPEVRIAAAVMANIYNASKPWVGLFTPEQREEIKKMRRGYREFNGVKVNHDRVWELVHNEGYSVLEALRISREEGNN